MQVPPLKCWYVSTRLHDVIFHNTMRLILFPLKNMFPLICRLILRQSIYWCFSCTRMFPRDGLNWVSSIMCSLFCVCVWRNSPHWARASSFTRFLDHTQRHTTVGRTPLDEWSTRRRDLYLTTHNTHIRQTSMPPVGFEPIISAGERPQTYALDRAATGTGSTCSLRS